MQITLVVLNVKEEEIGLTLHTLLYLQRGSH